MMWWCQLVISNSRGIEEFQVSPGKNLLFALTCWNSLLVFLPGILATSEWLDQQPDLSPSSSSGGPCAVTLGCSLLLPLSTALVGSGGAEQSLARLIALSAAGLEGRERMEQDSCYLHGVSIPLNLGRPQTHSLLLPFNTQAYSLKHAFLFRPIVKSNIARVTRPNCIRLHFRVFQMLFSTRIQKGKKIKVKGLGKDA